MKFLDKLANFIVKGRWYFFGIFLVLTIASAVLMNYVGVNYDLTKYLPNDSPTKIALNVMEDEFGASGTASVMIENCTIEQANSLQQAITEVDGVASVIFDSLSPSYYDGTNALLKIFFDTGDYTIETANAITQIRNVCNEYEVAMSGSAVDATVSRNAIGSEMIIILLIAIVIVLLILTLTSKSWLEPIVYLIVIGCAILINMGTNLILGEISFITESISAIMLIALEMDYCIVLCSRYREEQKKGLSPLQAMTSALSGSFMAIIASSCTVMAGLVALMFMDFTIGFDIGAVLAKGVFISILAVLFFMPSVILIFSKLLNKTTHRNFLPKMDKIATFANKTKVIIPIIFLCLIVTGAVLQSGVQFSYVANSGQQGSQVQVESAKIEEHFGIQNSLVVIVPKGDTEKEMQLYNDIINIEVDGEKYINSQSAITDTSLYTKLYKEDLSLQFGLDENTINMLFALMQTQNDYIYTIDLLNFLQNNKTLIDSAFGQKENELNSLKNSFAELNYNNTSIFSYLTLAQAKEVYTLSNETIMDNIFASILQTTQIESEQTLPNYLIMYALYQNNFDGYQETLSPIFESPLQPFKSLNQSEIINNYSLPLVAVQSIYEALNLNDNDTIFAVQLVDMLTQNINGTTILESVKTSLNATIQSGIIQMQNAQSMFCSDNYDRMIFNLNLAVDDEKAISFIEQLNLVLTQSRYNEYYVANNTSNLIDTQNTFSTDRIKTDLITIFAILVIILLAFRSISVPIILVLTIQGAIWCNFAISNLAGESIFFVCYLLAMAIQMGATIDYGILLTDRYVNFRKKYNKVESLKKALNTSITTILTSGLILILAAFTIHFVSTTPLISEIGLLIGRGALISVIAVLFVLPQLLLLFDKVIEKTTWKKTFYKEATVTNNKENKDTIENNLSNETNSNLLQNNLNNENNELLQTKLDNESNELLQTNNE